MRPVSSDERAELVRQGLVRMVEQDVRAGADRLRARGWVAPVLAVILVTVAVTAVIVVPTLTGSQSPSSPPLSTSTDTEPVEVPSDVNDFALRTSGADQNVLVATYAGGECDGDVALVTQESALQVDVGLSVPVVESGRPCSAVGVPRTLRVRLDTPLADRAVVINGRQFIPFDGSLVLFPTQLPDGLALTGERGQNDSTVGSDATATTSWTLTFGDQAAGRHSPAGQCLPSKGEVIISVAPPAPASLESWAHIGTAEVRGNSANISSSPPDSGPTRIVIVWPEQGFEYQLWSTTVCDGDTPLTWQELLAIAQSLQPDA